MNRYDFVLLFDVTDGNPNGDPDAGNLPRIDPETGQGLVTDVCLKRKIRNYVALTHANPENGDGHHIYVQEKAVLNQQHEKAYAALDIDPKKRKSKGKDKAAEDQKLTQWMCKNFFDIRTFGAVMTTDINCGQVRGPVQFALGRSIDPIISQEHAVTRCAVTTEREAEKQQGDNRTMGRKFTVPYGLYRCHGFVNPHLAAQTGFSDEDLELFKKSLEQMFEFDRSAARGQMAARACYAFRHESELGNAPAHKLFDLIRIQPADEAKPPRNFDDYHDRITHDADIEKALPAGVTLERWF